MAKLDQDQVHLTGSRHVGCLPSVEHLFYKIGYGYLAMGFAYTMYYHALPRPLKHLSSTRAANAWKFGGVAVLAALASVENWVAWDISMEARRLEAEYYRIVSLDRSKALTSPRFKVKGLAIQTQDAE